MPEQEPVAYKYTDKTNPLVFYFTTHKDSLPNPDVIETALYTAPHKREVDMSTKPENIDTSAERVQETDKSVHEDDIQIQMKSRDEIADSVMNVLLRRSSPDVLKESPLIIAEWAYGLSDAMLVMSRAKPHSFESNRINIKLMEKIVAAMEKEK
jgi:hypothetical protein